MRLEKQGGFYLIVLIMLWIAGNTIYYIESISKPNAELVEKAKRENAANEPKHNDTGLYSEVLSKIKTCELNVESSTDNKFYNCPNNEKITQIHWERGQGSRKGIVTRYFDSTGKLLLIYGHPDDE